MNSARTARTRAAIALAALVLAALGHALRDPGLLIRPILWNEDALVLFPRFFANGGDPAGILDSHAGYASLAPGLVGWLVAGLPPAWAPHAYLLAALLGNALAVAPLLLPRAGSTLGPLLTRAALVLLLSLAPAGSIAIAASVMHLNWPILLAACLLTVLPPPATRLAGFATGVAIALALWTNPLALICVPPLALRAIREPGARVPAALAAVAALAFLVRGVDGTGAALVPAHLPGNLLAGLELVGTRAVLEAFIGSEAMAALATAPVARGLAALTGWAILAALAVLAARGRKPGRRLFVATLVALVLGLTIGSVVARDLGASYGLALRYFHTPKLLTLLLAGVVAADTLGNHDGRRAAVTFLAAVWLGGLTAAQIGWYRAATFTDPDRGARLRAFLVEVSKHPAEAGMLAVFPDRRNIFDMVLRRSQADLPIATGTPALPRPGTDRSGLAWFVEIADGRTAGVEERPGAAADWRRAVGEAP